MHQRSWLLAAFSGMLVVGLCAGVWAQEPRTDPEFIVTAPKDEDYVPLGLRNVDQITVMNWFRPQDLFAVPPPNSYAMRMTAGGGYEFQAEPPQLLTRIRQFMTVLDNSLERRSLKVECRVVATQDAEIFLSSGPDRVQLTLPDGSDVVVPGSVLRPAEATLDTPMRLTPAANTNLSAARLRDALAQEALASGADTVVSGRPTTGKFSLPGRGGESYEMPFAITPRQGTNGLVTVDAALPWVDYHVGSTGKEKPQVSQLALRYTAYAGQAVAVGIVSNRPLNGDWWYVCLVTVTPVY